jgi:chromosomal replication initiation ATPase DnaA
MIQQKIPLVFKTSYTRDHFFYEEDLRFIQETDHQFIKIMGPSKSGKTHMISLIEQEYPKAYIIDDAHLQDDIQLFHIYNRAILEKNTFILTCLNNYMPHLPDWMSRFQTFYLIDLGLVNDEFLKKIFHKIMNDYGIVVDNKISDYILKYVERTYDTICEIAHYFGKMRIPPTIRLIQNIIKHHENNTI